MNRYFSIKRLWAIIKKEFIQLKRDRVTLIMTICIPIVELLLFGYAINTNPKNLPTTIISADHSVFTRDFITGLKHTNYFTFINNITESEADKLMRMGKLQFIIRIPQNFSHDLIRGEKPDISLTTDATDIIATSSATASAKTITQQIFDDNFRGSLSFLKNDLPAVNLVLHAKYNPEFITQYGIVPGLIGLILMIALTIITSLAITREYERGTIESLLSTPARPTEVLIGKVLPFVLIGYIQISLILIASYYIFHVPIIGKLWLLLVTAFPFIIANLAIGITLSTIAKNQLQVVQMEFLFFLPSILLSGFFFPFYGMPKWAQHIGSILPLTYFLRISRGIILKGNGLATTWPNTWPIIVFMIIALAIGIKKYRETLD